MEFLMSYSNEYNTENNIEDMAINLNNVLI